MVSSFDLIICLRLLAHLFFMPTANAGPLSQNVTWPQWGHRQTETYRLGPKESRISPK